MIWIKKNLEFENNYNELNNKIKEDIYKIIKTKIV